MEADKGPFPIGIQFNSTPKKRSKTISDWNFHFHLFATLPNYRLVRVTFFSFFPPSLSLTMAKNPLLCSIVLLAVLAGATSDDGAELDYSKLSGIIIPGFASTQLRAWSILDCPYSPLDFNPLDLVWLDTTKVRCNLSHSRFVFLTSFWILLHEDQILLFLKQKY